MRLVVAVVGVAVAVLAVAGCSAAQSGNQNPGPGYTNNLPDLVVKISALRSDPCRSAQAPQIYGNCGRYVTEVASMSVALKSEVPSQSTEINALSGAVHTYQSLTCDTISGQPTSTQASLCPQALTTIGADLDKIGPALSSLPTGNP